MNPCDYPTGIYYRVAEISPAYDMIPGTDSIYEPGDDGTTLIEQPIMRPGPGWIYIFTTDDLFRAWHYGYNHTKRTGFNVRIDTFSQVHKLLTNG